MADNGLGQAAPNMDTSSYRLPAGPNALDTFGKLQTLKQQSQGIEQNQVNIDKSKMELAMKGIDYMTGEINSLPPDATPDQVFKVLQNGVNQKFLTPEIYAQAIKEVPTDQKEMPAFKNRYISRAMQARQALEYQIGQTGTFTDGPNVYQTRTSPNPAIGTQINPNPIANIKLAPGTQVPDERESLPDGTPNPAYGQPRFTVPAGGPLVNNQPVNTGPLPVGRSMLPDGSGMEVGPNTAGQPPRGAPLPVARPANIPNSFAERFPAAGLPPGEAQAVAIGAEASAGQAAKARQAAASYQRDIFPLNEAIPALEKLGTKGTGPGTETINNIKSFVLANVPGVKENDFNGTVAGVLCYVTTDGSGNWTIYRVDAGDAVAVAAGSVITPENAALARQILGAYGAGRNGPGAGAGGSGSGYTMDGDRAAYVSHIRHRGYLICGETTATADSEGTISAITARIAAGKALYGARYVDFMPALLAAAISDPEDPGYADDQADVAAGKTPRSLLSDGLHFNATGKAIKAATYVAAHQALGYP